MNSSLLARVSDRNRIGLIDLPARSSVFSPIVIEANGARLEHAANGVNFRSFAVGSASVNLNPVGTPDIVSGTGSLTIRNAHIKGFTVKGGDGGDGTWDGNDENYFGAGGGGGRGAGGAIYVNRGTLILDRSTFEANGAVGGNGGTAVQIPLTGAGGGGGGLAGNGGGTGPYVEGGGGGGGARGDGGRGGGGLGAGGGGGGAITAGAIGGSGASEITGGAAGIACGGKGADATGSFSGVGADAACDGGGGGGGGVADPLLGKASQDGGAGKYGGGGGANVFAGLILPDADGGKGGFGGGGGGAAGLIEVGGSSEFGGGGGGGDGAGGSFGGHGGAISGGGGAALGGAVFNDAGTVLVYNSTFARNFVARGVAGGGDDALNGRDAGGAIFSVDGTVKVFNSTIAFNETTGDGGGIVFYRSTRSLSGLLDIHNTIITNNRSGAVDTPRQCFVTGSSSNMTNTGSGNIIEWLADASGDARCRGVYSETDPGLGPLLPNPPGTTPTMAIEETSPAYNTGDPVTALPTDQRGVTRPQAGAYDIGAYELLPPMVDFSLSAIAPIDVPLGGSGSATVTITSVNGFNDLVKFAPWGVPAGITPSFVPDSITPAPNASASVVMNVSVSASLPAGTYAFTVRALAGPHLYYDTTATVNVGATADSLNAVIATYQASGAIDRIGTANAFSSKVIAAQSLAAAGQTGAAVNTLGALAYQIRALSGIRVDASAASVLITDVTSLQQSIDPGLSAMPVVGFARTAAGQGVAGATVDLLNGTKKPVMSTTTDATGMYTFARTGTLPVGTGYTLRLSVPKGYSGASPATQAFTWVGTFVSVSDFEAH